MSEKRGKRTMTKPVDEVRKVIEQETIKEEIIEQKKEEPIKGVVKDCMNLNVRSNPSIDSEILGTIPKNHEVIVLDDSEEGWFKINVTGIGTGFCMSKYINVKF